MADDSTLMARRRALQALPKAVSLPLGMMAVCAAPQLIWPAVLSREAEFGILAGAGIVGYALGQRILQTALGGMRAPWIVIGYSIGTPLAIMALIMLVDVVRMLRLTR